MDLFQALILVERLMDDRERIDAVPGGGNGGFRFGVTQLPALKVEEARNDLEIVFDPVMNLAHGRIAAGDSHFKILVALTDILCHDIHGAGEP